MHMFCRLVGLLKSDLQLSFLLFDICGICWHKLLRNDQNNLHQGAVVHGWCEVKGQREQHGELVPIQLHQG